MILAYVFKAVGWLGFAAIWLTLSYFKYGLARRGPAYDWVSWHETYPYMLVLFFVWLGAGTLLARRGHCGVILILAHVLIVLLGIFVMGVVGAFSHGFYPMIGFL